MEKLELIDEIDKKELEWWKKLVRETRIEIVPKPKEIVDKIYNKENFANKFDELDSDEWISQIRNNCWEYYGKKEIYFHKEVINKLINERSLPKKILDSSIKDVFVNEIESFSPTEIKNKFAPLFGSYTGQMIPYLYALTLSTTQSRRSRAGSEFELIVYKFLELNGISFDEQSKLGNDFFNRTGTKKIVDCVIPGGDYYLKSRTETLIISCKTTLRERWAEVAEEMQRANLHKIYLCTLDDGLTLDTLKTINAHNIILVTLSSIIKDLKRKYGSIPMSVKSFDELIYDCNEIQKRWK